MSNKYNRANTLVSHKHLSPVGTLDAVEDANNKVLISGGYDGRVISWAGNGEPRWAVSLPDIINHVSICSSASLLAVACADSYVYGLNLDDGAVQFKLGPHEDDVNSVAWHPSGNYLISVADSKDGSTHLWSVQTLQRESRLYSHEAAVYSVRFEPSGERFATSGADHKVKIYNFETRELLLELLHGNANCETVAWSPDGLSVVTGCADGTVIVWNAHTGEQKTIRQVASSASRHINFSIDGESLLVGAYDGLLRVVRLPDLKLLKSLTANFQWERTALFFDDAIIVGSFTSMPIWHYSNDKQQIPSHGTESHTIGINSITGNRQKVIFGRDDGSVIDLESCRVLYRHRSIVNSVALSDNSEWIASGDYQGNLILYREDKQQALKEKASQTGGPINALVWGKDSQVIITGGYDGCIRWWSKALDLIAEVKAHQSPIKSLAYCKNSGRLITGSSDNTISCWQDTKRVYTATEEKVELINSVYLSPIKNEFATASRDGQIRIWDLETGCVIDVLPIAHQKSVKSVAYSPDGKMLVSGSYDASAVVWHKKNNIWHWRNLNFHSKPGVAASYFGENYIYTAGWDGLVAQWDKQGIKQKHYSFERL